MRIVSDVVLLALVIGAAGAIGAFGAIGCGGAGEEGPGQAATTGPEGKPIAEATLVLDYIPGAVHAGIYRAEAAGYYRENGIDLRIIQPTSTADTLKLIDAGRADFGVADGIDLATQIEQGREAKGIMALLQRPAGGLITLARERIRSPADLAGETVGVTGVPSDDAVLERIMTDAGSSPDETRVVTIGFNGVQTLEAGRIQAFTGFIPADATQAEVDGFPTRSFALDEYGGPSYPGLVIFSTETKITADPDLMQGFVEATTRGYRDALADPDEAIDALISETQGIKPTLALRSFTAWEPLMGPADTFGRFEPGKVRDLSAFLLDSGLITAPIAPDRYATNRFAGSSGPGRGTGG